MSVFVVPRGDLDRVLDALGVGGLREQVEELRVDRRAAGDRRAAAEAVLALRPSDPRPARRSNASRPLRSRSPARARTSRRALRRSRRPPPAPPRRQRPRRVRRRTRRRASPSRARRTRRADCRASARRRGRSAARPARPRSRRRRRARTSFRASSPSFAPMSMCRSSSIVSCGSAPLRTFCFARSTTPEKLSVLRQHDHALRAAAPRRSNLRRGGRRRSRDRRCA